MKIEKYEDFFEKSDKWEELFKQSITTGDYDGAGANDKYIMFDIYYCLLSAAGIHFPKKYLSGETIATFKANGVYKNCRIRTNKNPHLLGNFMPYPGRSKGKSRHSTKQRDSRGSSLQELHNTQHNENPFKMLKDIEQYYNFLEDPNKVELSMYGKAVKAADEDIKICKDGFWKQFGKGCDGFKKFVDAMRFEYFVVSKYFNELKWMEGKWRYDQRFFKPGEYFAECVKLITKRTEKLVEIPCIQQLVTTSPYNQLCGDIP